MNKNKYLPIFLVLIAIVIVVVVAGGYYFWQRQSAFCRSPIEVIDIKEALNHTSSDKSGLRLSRLFPNFYAGTLPPHSQSVALFHRMGPDYFVILSGKATLHSGRQPDEKDKKISWFRNIDIGAGEAFAVPPNTVFQLATHDEPLTFLLSAEESHFKNGRSFVEGYQAGDGCD